MEVYDESLINYVIANVASFVKWKKIIPLLSFASNTYYKDYMYTDSTCNIEGVGIKTSVLAGNSTEMTFGCSASVLQSFLDT